MDLAKRFALLTTLKRAGATKQRARRRKLRTVEQETSRNSMAIWNTVPPKPVRPFGQFQRVAHAWYLVGSQYHG